ncbi:MAG: ABC transporter substrate-binding protein [Candidatus Hodarchaeales archaeon]|jgi:peptide/nickel transport system substrate-binding protein
MKSQYLLTFFLVSCFLLSNIFVSTSTYKLSVNTASSLSVDSNEVTEDPLLRVLSFFFDNAGTLQNFDFLTSFSPLPSLVFDSLVDYSFESDELIPSLATSWVVSLDSRHWTFFLRRDVFFHDGTPFNATSVKFSYDRIIDPSHPAFLDPGMYALDLQAFPLESVSIMNPFTVIFHFSEPYAPFVYNEASLLGIYSPTSFNGPNISSPIGTGLYQLTESSNNLSTYLLTRNPHHFRGVPPFSQILYRVFEEYLPYEEAVDNQEGDFALVPLDPLLENDTHWEYSFGWRTLELGWFNHSNPYLADSRVRSAINYAINKTEYTLSPGYQSPRRVLTSIIHSDSSFHDESVPGFPFYLELANTLLDAAGYPRASDGFRFSLNLSTNDLRGEKAYYVQNQLIKIGINPILSFPNHEDFYNGLLSFDIFIGGYGGAVDPSYVWNYLHSSGRLNLGGFNDTFMDLLLSNAQYTPVEQEREYYYYLIQRLSQEKVPYLFLGEGHVRYLRASSISSLVEWNLNAEIGFNFPLQTDPLFSISKIPVSFDPLYCQLADIVIFPDAVNHDSSIALEYASRSHHFLPSQKNNSGKFYRLTAAEQGYYSLRFYYDNSDFTESVDIGDLSLYVWNQSLFSWNELEPISTDLDFRYIEVFINLSSDPLILGFGFDVSSFLVRSFTYLFPYLLLLGTVSSLGVMIILFNRIFLKNIKEEFVLP